MFEKCLSAAGAHHGPGYVGASPPKWVLCGDLNTSVGSILTWKRAFEYSGDPIRIHQAIRNASNNKAEDYMLSQGFSTTHIESTIGCSEKSRKHATDSHDMVTLMGHPTHLKCGSEAPNFAPSFLRSVQPTGASNLAPSAAPASSYAQVCRSNLPMPHDAVPVTTSPAVAEPWTNSVTEPQTYYRTAQT